MALAEHLAEWVSERPVQGSTTRSSFSIGLKCLGFLWVPQRARPDGGGCLVLDSLGSAGTWVWILSAILVLGICFSRLYLGVHDLEDVIGGMGIGFVSLLLVILLSTRRFEWLQHMHPSWQIVVIAIVEAFFFLTWPGKIPEQAGWSGVFLIGFWSGLWIERKRLLFQKHRDRRRVLASGVVGIIVFIVFLIAFRTVMDTLGTARTVAGLIYALFSGAYVAALAPWIFQNLRLANRCEFTG